MWQCASDPPSGVTAAVCSHRGSSSAMPRADLALESGKKLPWIQHPKVVG